MGKPGGRWGGIAAGILGLGLALMGLAGSGGDAGDGLAYSDGPPLEEQADTSFALLAAEGDEAPAAPAGGDSRRTIPDGTMSTDLLVPPMALTRRALSLLETHYLLPEKLAPADLFRGAVERLAAVADDGLFLPGEAERLDTLMIGRRSVLLDGAALTSADQLADALAAVASFYRQSTVFHDIESDEELENTLIAGMMATLDSPTRLLIDRGLENFEVRSRGSLIGVGLVLRIRDGRPLVVEVVDGGPSQRGGVKRGDRILRIDGETTLDMPLRDVVSRLRGEADTQVTMAIERRGADAPVSITVSREKVNVENVRVARLDGDIGYLEITNFSDLTLTNFRLRMAELNAGGPLKGFILDLRANRGGSLRQSAFMADQFLSQGLLVRTSGRGDERVRGLVERIDATPDITIPADLPVAVLVSPSTASGAEILAGSLKYHDRAVILGQSTYGKGTVQKVYKLAPGASLKATVARYLLEGDHWIHKVGIEPDIELRSIVVEDHKIRFDDGRDLAELLEEEDGPEDPFHGQAEPAAALGLTWVQVRAAEAEEVDGEEDAAPTPVPTRIDRIAEDFEVHFASILLQEAPQATRSGILAAAVPVLGRVTAEQEALFTQVLQARGVDWARSADKLKPRELNEVLSSLKVEVRGGGPQGLVPAEEDVPLTLSASVGGRHALHRVRVTTVSADRLLSGHDFLFGRLASGGAVEATVPIRLPPSEDPGLRLVTLVVTAEELPEPVEIQTTVAVAPIPRPRLDVRVSYREDGEGGSAGDGDLIPEAGERLVMEIAIANHGPVASGELSVALRNPLRKDVEIVESRVRLDPLAPGQTARGVVSFDVKAVPEVADLPPVEVSLTVRDRTFGFGMDEPLLLAAEAPAEGAAPEGAAAPRQPPSWARDGLLLRPPQVEVRSVSPAGIVETGALDLSVAATDEDGIRVLTLYRDRVKVGRLVGGTGAQALDLTQSVPLPAGTHLIEVVAEDQRGLTSREQLWASAVPAVVRAEADTP